MLFFLLSTRTAVCEHALEEYRKKWYVDFCSRDFHVRSVQAFGSGNGQKRHPRLVLLPPRDVRAANLIGFDVEMDVGAIDVGLVRASASFGEARAVGLDPKDSCPGVSQSVSQSALEEPAGCCVASCQVLDGGPGLPPKGG